MTKAHADRSHALLSASGSKRWLTCTPSARLEEQFEEETSAYAEEGTLAHEISEVLLEYHTGQIAKATRTRRLNKLKKNDLYSDAMLEYVTNYADIVIEKFNELAAEKGEATILLEQRLDYSKWVPEGFGTGDALIIADGVIEVIDLKYGKGVPVEAEENTQMMLYALGAINQFEMLYDIEQIRVSIVQPRLDSVSSYELSIEELMTWADEYVKQRAEMAWKGKGAFKAGEHCRFCRAKATCAARAEKNLEMAKYDFQKPELLSKEDLGQILLEAEELKRWAKDVQDYALAQAEHHGEKIPGWKLVEGRSNRKYADRETVRNTLLAEGFEPDQILTPREVLGVSALEKSIGKKAFNEILQDLIIKPAGKPTLVPESDKRPELNSTESAIADFQ
ncbi:DUF2800 domain-containing protein [Bacillus paralicheniformis]|uniref:DUF2800 domain-containing protein n=1 Tax=Bacillus paralicheniformis TaxID=1648923 RepID=UPI001CC6951F|nr:DUF2800 domain-containing protein [Bacillus paralicheniformis]UAY70706.1 DUF2800 domain-containing protein [Bacillus paralicheniformis]